MTAYSSLARGGDAVATQLGSKLNLFNDELLKEIATAHKKTIAQVVLNYLVSQNIIVLPKTEKIERLKENIDFYDFSLTEEEKKKIKLLDKNLRTVDTTTVRLSLFLS